MAVSASFDASPQHKEADEIVQQLLTYPPDDPYPLLARVRDISPVHKTAGGIWTLARYDHIASALRDPRFIRDIGDMTRRQLGDGVDFARPLIESRQRWFHISNPPEYMRKRSVYAKFLTPAAVDKLRAEIEENANKLLDVAEERGEIELVGEFSYELTLKLICRILGFPPPDGEGAEFLEWFRAWGDTFQAVVTPEMLDLADDAILNLNGLLGRQVDRMRIDPGDNLISRLAHEVYNDARLPDDEIVANAIVMFAGAVGTTADLISNTVVSLLENTDQWELLRRDPVGLAKNAVEETLRYDSSVIANPPSRLAAEDVEIGGLTIPAGDVVIPLFAAGNRDPKRFENPDTFDITREDVRPLSFGGGVHVCPGQHLARAQSEIAVRILATRFPNMTLAVENPPRRANAAQRGAAELHVRLA